MLFYVEGGDNLMLTRLTPVATPPVVMNLRWKLKEYCQKN